MGIEEIYKGYNDNEKPKGSEDVRLSGNDPLYYALINQENVVSGNIARII
jgi:hypothetical protein